MSSCCKCKTAAITPRKAASRWIRFAFAGIVAAQSMILGLAVNLSAPEEPARMALHGLLAVSAVTVFLLTGLPLARAAWDAARNGRVAFEQLFLVGIAGAFAASLVSTLSGQGHIYYEVVAVLLAIYTFGRVLGENRRAAALDAARGLGTEFEMCERVDSEGRLERIPASALREGDIVHVPAGSAVPVDGVVVDGAAFINESALTGEPFPVVRRAGDIVRAGGHSVDGALRVRANGGPRQIDGIISRISAAQAHPSRLEREADRLVAWFLPLVLLAAAGTFAFWTWHAGWTTGLFNALAVVLVACPCSMGLATPIGVWSALADLARRGVVAASSDLVERLAGVKAAVFDKTGTLGEEHLDLVDFVAAPGFDRSALLAEAAALEAASCHPIARAFRPHASRLVANAVRLIPGRGLAGDVGGAKLEITNSAVDHTALADRLRGGGGGSRVLFVLRDSRLAGAALLRERLRDSAQAVIASLEAEGIPCTILTGDSVDAHGLPAISTGLSPLEKADRVHSLGNRVLFVGDGINDAAAMAVAHAALCVAEGSAIARQAAGGDVLDLGAIPWALARCRAAVRVIRRNLLFAACYNAIGISLAVAGLLHPVAAALLMLASSFTVSWNALRNPRLASDKPETQRPLELQEATA